MRMFLGFLVTCVIATFGFFAALSMKNPLAGIYRRFWCVDHFYMDDIDTQT